MKIKKQIVLILDLAVFTFIGCQPRQSDNQPQTVTTDSTAKPVQTQADGIPARPVPPTAISDFAHIMSDSVREALEYKLTRFENQRHLPVVVVTVASFDTTRYGDILDFGVALFKKWGIGYAGANNGTLLILSVHPRAVRLLPGKGMEEYLTDDSCGVLLRNYMQQPLQRNHPDSAFVAEIEALVSFINRKVPTEEQLAMMKKNEEARQKKVNAVLWQVGEGVILIIIGILVAFFLRFISRSIERNAEQKAIKKHAQEVYATIESELDNVTPAIEKARKEAQAYPPWAQKELEGYINEVQRLIKSITHDFNDASHYLEYMPANALDNMNALHERYVQALSAYTKGTTVLPQKIASFAEQAPLLKESVDKLLHTLKSDIEALRTDGWRIFEDDAAACEAMQKEYEEKITLLSDSKAICDACNVLKQKIAFQQNNIQTEYSMLSLNSTHLALYTTGYENAQGMLADVKKAIEYLQKNTPKNVWLPLQANLARASLSIQDIPAKLQQATVYNTKEVQKFAEAAALLESAESNLRRNVSLLKAIIQQQADWQVAIEAYPALKKSVAQQLKVLLEKMKHSDVTATTKNAAKQAATVFTTLEAMVDIVAASASLQNLLRTISDIQTKADTDIRTAKLARTDDSSSKTSKNNDDSGYISSPWSGGNESAPSPTFSGFAGGETGGGGAGISY